MLPSCKPIYNVSNTKKPVPAASGASSNMSTARNHEMACHTCGGKGHFKRYCPSRKVMIVNQDNEYETGDDVDPNAPEDDDYDSDGFDAFPSEAQTIVVSQRVLNVQSSASTQRCNLFQTKALVEPDKACKVIIDGGSCRNLASKELCAKLKLKYLPHPHPYYIQWLSNNGEMKVSHMVRVDFEIGPYKDSIDFDVVPMTVCHLLLGRPWLYDRSVQHNGRANTYHLEFKGKKINLQLMSPHQIVNESRQKVEVNLEDAPIDRRENCNTVCDITKSERVNSLVLLATKEDMREFSEDPTTMPLVLMHRGTVLVSNDMTPIPLGVSNVLQEFSDVFPEEVPAGLPPLCGIEHQIDLIPGASLPNRAPYRTNPKRRRRYSKYKRYSTKENLGILTRPYFPASTEQKDKSSGGPRAPHQGGARPRGPARPYGVAPGRLSTPSFGLYIGLDLKRTEEVEVAETLRNAATSRNSVSGARSLRSGTPPDGELEEIIAIITANASHRPAMFPPSMCEKRTPDDAEELLAKIGRNHDDWTTPEPTPTPILKKRGMIKLNDKDMREAKKSLKEKGIKSEDVKNLPPIEDICEIIPPSSMIEGGLATYVGDEREQYYMLTKIFVESFKFQNTQYEPTVAFKIYGNPVTMELEEFCRALDIAPVGTARRIDDNPRDLLELYRGITNDDCRTIQRGKIRNIQLPAIKYFAYYIATSILGRENTSNISSYHLAFLNIALTGRTSYHLGSLIARRLSNRGPIFGGIIASRVLAYLELPIDPNDVSLTPRRLDITAMKIHHFVTTDSTIDNMVYRMLFADGDEKEIPLPQPGLFCIDRQPWSRTKEEVDEHMKIQDFHQQHDSEDAEPSYDYTVTYPGASSSTYPEYDPSSSYYGDTTSWPRWD
ncbi:hypothetical protein QYE76_003138 [Lolium multiflorum]|uniref:CCHC-type domain-containing protein n=1 Tax=Lolium multiflorum TaxID=4521 RepID=A0AAD8RPK9_LOLMU|nr:hypothetical protein QYE76_003138 [Lolium multiflorum]